MKESSPTAPKEQEKKSILLIGPPGGGKTTLLMQFPNLCILDCDRNLDGPEQFVRTKLDPKLRYWYEPIYMDENKKPVPVEKAYDYLMGKLDEVSREPDVKVVAIDSLTHINEFIIRKIIATQKGADTMEARDWIPFKSYFLNLLVSKIRGLGKHAICTVHEMPEWQTDPKNIMVKNVRSLNPSVQGSVADFLGAFFTDMWRCYIQLGAQTKPEFYIRTTKTTLSDLKNSCGLPPDIKNPTFVELNKYLKLA